MSIDGAAHWLDELDSARCAVPFEFLGLHPAPGGTGMVLRVWRPGCDWIEVIDLDARRNLGRMMRVGDSDLFLCRLSRRRQGFNYRLRLGLGKRVAEDDDPYQFRRAVFANTPGDRNRLHQCYGAHPATLAGEGGRQVAGVRFMVHAPAARSVSVVGVFNGWDGRRHPMHSSFEGDWRLFIPGLQPGALYKFEIKGPDGALLPLKADPFGRFHEQPPGNASIVCAPSSYAWRDAGWIETRRADGYRNDRPMAIYELHAGSWRHRDGRPLSYRELADVLVPYLQDTGFSHVEFMPLAEHPFAASWGYQPTGLFAASSRFGPPDDFRHLVDCLHAAGIGVIMDWVPGHFPADPHGLGRFDGTALYEHEDPRRGWHPDWNTHIYDFGKSWVRDFLVSSALCWIEDFHIDGLRVDAVASMLYLDYSRQPGEWLPNRFGGNQNLEAIDFLKRFNETVHAEHPGVMTIAEESTAWPGVSRPTYDGGLGFGFKWNMGWMHDTLGYMARDPVHRRFHHGELTFGFIYAWDENFVLPLSHDEVVHGKGSLLGRMPGDEWQRFANLRLYLAFMYAHPGKKLLFMGAELAQAREWNHDTELDWALLDQPGHRGVHDLLRDLNRQYRATPAMWEADHTPDGFEWIDYSDADHGVLAFLRHDARRDAHLLCVLNFTPVVHHDYRLGVPHRGRYREVLNTDAGLYGGSNVGNQGAVETSPQPSHGRGASVVLTLPPLAAIWLIPEPG
ncbi:1,4-alpha-glucan branching protein GlgB [Wenzhouxiangella sp. XN24]|uniref:1,4-alpha-glucan branching protein GlgB n=1 Tax=Wenzhouxiangella sp. XN24 TaxID=2713569 RepID=UPI0013ED9CA6|nr:1,4-alpha-glucan branching protein GlgB [Wenzhouxiangella sp. XN24]NGX16512.1 1,4-alpha-glucan branching protein GlgB [Wenzhouxiangella sp. XN24]